jgi:hypothetical protein
VSGEPAQVITGEQLDLLTVDRLPVERELEVVR